MAQKQVHKRTPTLSDKTVAIAEIEKDMQRYVGALSEDFQGKTPLSPSNSAG